MKCLNYISQILLFSGLAALPGKTKKYTGIILLERMDTSAMAPSQDLGFG